MHLPRSRWVVFVVAAVVVAGIGACSDNLESNAACPSLCPGLADSLRDTVVDAVVIDSSVSGFPAIGQEPFLLIGTRGDTLDTRGIIRYDSLPTFYMPTNSPADSAIVGVDSASLMLRVDTSETKPGAPVTISLYDVDTGGTDSSATDTAVAVLAPLFSPDRLLGSKTFAPESLVDSLRVPLSNDSVYYKLSHGRPLRIGIQVTGTDRAQIRIGTSVNFVPPQLMFKPAPHGDTTGVTFLSLSPMTRTPVGSPLVNDLQDYLIVLKGTPNTTAPLLTVGGLPGHRVYLRFNLPSSIVDSSTVVRATLLLMQVPNPLSPDARDSTTVWPQALLASSAITDLGRALRLLAAAGAIGLDTLERFAPADSGLRQFEMVQLVRAWHTGLTATDPRALALRTALEGESGAEYWFYSSKGPLALRPRIRLTYAPNRSVGGSP